MSKKDFENILNNLQATKNYKEIENIKKNIYYHKESNTNYINNIEVKEPLKSDIENECKERLLKVKFMGNIKAKQTTTEQKDKKKETITEKERLEKLEEINKELKELEEKNDIGSVNRRKTLERQKYYYENSKIINKTKQTKQDFSNFNKDVKEKENETKQEKVEAKQEVTEKESKTEQERLNFYYTRLKDFQHYCKVKGYDKSLKIIEKYFSGLHEAMKNEKKSPYIEGNKEFYRQYYEFYKQYEKALKEYSKGFFGGETEEERKERKEREIENKPYTIYLDKEKTVKKERLYLKKGMSRSLKEQGLRKTIKEWEQWKEETIQEEKDIIEKMEKQQEPKNKLIDFQTKFNYWNDRKKAKDKEYNKNKTLYKQGKISKEELQKSKTKWHYNHLALEKELETISKENESIKDLYNTEQDYLDAKEKILKELKEIKKKKQRKKDTSKTDLIQKNSKEMFNKPIILEKQILVSNNEIKVYNGKNEIVDNLLNIGFMSDSYYTSCYIKCLNLIYNLNLVNPTSIDEDFIDFELDREQIKEVFQIKNKTFEPIRLEEKFNRTTIRTFFKINENEYIIRDLEPFYITIRDYDLKNRKNLKNNKNEKTFGIARFKVRLSRYFSEKLLKSINYFHFIKDFYKIVFEYLANKEGLFNENYVKTETDYIYKVFFCIFNYYNDFSMDIKKIYEKLKNDKKIKDKDKEKLEDLKNGFLKIAKNRIYEFIKDANFNIRIRNNTIRYTHLNKKELEPFTYKVDYFLKQIDEAIKYGKEAHNNFLKIEKKTYPKACPKTFEGTELLDSDLIFKIEPCKELKDILKSKEIQEFLCKTYN